jgi:hypothetical protein
MWCTDQARFSSSALSYRYDARVSGYISSVAEDGKDELSLNAREWEMEKH